MELPYKAFDGDVEPGGLRDKNQIKVLVCYLLKNVGRPLSFENLNEILRHDGLVNYFELSQAVKELLETGHLDLTEKDGVSFYRVTRLGAGTAGLFERDLPFSVREKAVRAGVKLLAKIRTESENRAEIEELPAGGFRVNCSILDNADELMKIAVLVPERGQAAAVKQSFLENPSTVYQGVLALLTGDRRAFRALLDK